MRITSVHCESVPLVAGEGHKAPNRIKTYVAHDKDLKFAYISVRPCHVGGGFETVVLRSGRLIEMEAMPRLNRKRLESLAAQASAEIAARDGWAWDVVESVVEKEGLTLEPAPTTPLLDEDEIEIIELED